MNAMCRGWLWIGGRLKHGWHGTPTRVLAGQKPVRRGRRWVLQRAVGVALACVPGGLAVAQPVRVPLDVPTIADALEAVGDGGVIQVAEGTHEGGFVITRGVTLQGGFPPNFDGPPDPWVHPTIITGSEGVNAAAARLGTGATATISGVICVGGPVGLDVSLTGDAFLNLNTVTCRDNARGLRLDAHDAAGLTAGVVLIHDNVFTGAGAGISVELDGEAGAIFTAAQIWGNRATDGGAAVTASVTGEAALTFLASTFADNGFENPSGQRGEPGTILYDVSESAALFLSECRVEGNIADTVGDAAVGGTQSGDSLVQIDGTEFREGRRGAGGEAIDARIAGTAALRVIGTSFENAEHLAGPALAVHAEEQGVGFILRNRFAGNTSGTHLITTEQDGSAFVNFDGNVVRGNTTVGEVIVMSVLRTGSGALLRAINNQVSGNQSTGSGGGGLFIVDGADIAQVGYNTFVGNRAASGTAGLHLIAGSNSPAQASNNVLVGNTTGGAPTDLRIEGFLARAFGNFLTGDGDPRFLDAGAGDFRLRADSPLIDAGHARAFSIDHDFEEDPRPILLRRDVGSDEFAPFGDFDQDQDVDLDDYRAFFGCFSGPDDGSQEFETPSAECQAFFDADDDDDIDVQDHAAFQRAFTGG